MPAVRTLASGRRHGHGPLTRAPWPVHEDTTGRVSAQQVAYEGQDHEQGLGGCRQGQAGQALGEGSHQVGGQVAGQEGGREAPHRPQQPPAPFVAPGCSFVGTGGPAAVGEPGTLPLLDTHEDDRKRSARWKKRARYLTWKMDGSRRP